MVLTRSNMKHLPNDRATQLPRVLYVGNREAFDFRAARRRLCADAERGECLLVDFDDASAAIASIAAQDESGHEPPDLFVLPQLRPGDLDPAEVHRLRRLAPLAGLVVLSGGWCEGEARSGQPLPGTARIAWHQFAPRWVRHRIDWRQRRSTQWSLPATWSDEERLVHATSASADHRELIEATIVLTDVPSLRDDWLAAVARAQGWQVARSSQLGAAQQPSTVGIWQSDALEGQELGELADFVSRVRPAPVIVVAGFPRPEDDERIRSVGATSLLAKPLLIDDLAAEVGWLLESKGGAQEP